MLSKCANPACHARFQYLHHGKLFAIEYRRRAQVCGSTSHSDLIQTHDRFRYFWLCSACCKSMTIQLSGTGGIRLALTAETYEMHQLQVGQRPGDRKGWMSDTIQVEGGNMMTANQKLSALKKELEFLEAGGYRQPMGWRPALVFEDSPICPKPPFSSCPNCQCALLDFVPEGKRDQTIPCQHIPLNEAGETLCTMYNTATIDEIEGALREWLRRRIAEIERAIDVEPLRNKQNVA
jgi:hypothetical protein